MAYRFPTRVRAGLMRIASTSDEHFAAFTDALKTMPLVLKPETLEVHVAKCCGDLSAEEVSTMTEAAVALHNGLQSADDEHGEYLAEVSKSLEPEENEPRIEPARILSRLAVLLDIPALALATKAMTLLFEDERILVGARIVTDIRPIFGTDGDGPNAALVVHSLKLRFQEDGRVRDIYLGIDLTDIKDLIKMLDRAILKDTSLKALLSKADITLVEPLSDSGGSR